MHNGCQLRVPPCHPPTPLFMYLYVFILACSACTLPARERTGSLQHPHTALLSAEVRGRVGRRKARGTKALPSQVFFFFQRLSKKSPSASQTKHKKAKQNTTKDSVIEPPPPSHNCTCGCSLLSPGNSNHHYPVSATERTGGAIQPIPTPLSSLKISRGCPCPMELRDTRWGCSRHTARWLQAPQRSQGTSPCSSASLPQKFGSSRSRASHPVIS